MSVHRTEFTEGGADADVVMRASVNLLLYTRDVCDFAEDQILSQIIRIWEIKGWQNRNRGKFEAEF